MNTITKTASTTTILAIDLGKYKCVACVHDQDSGEYRFTTFDTSRAELGTLLTKEQPAVVIIEACLLAGWVHDLCGQVGVPCLVANTASEAWKFKHLKRKTDKDDALRLAQLHLLGQLPTVTLPPTAVRQWRALIAVRQALVGRRVAVQNRIRALFVAQGLPVPPGLGPRTAETVAAYLDNAARFQRAKQVSAYSGLVPRQHQSGEMDRRGRISKRGPALLRKLLVECAWCMIRYNAWARRVYQRLTGGGQRRKKQAIVALARKILVRCWAMLRDRKPWHDPETGPKASLPPSKQRRQAEAQRRRQAQQPAALATS